MPRFQTAAHDAVKAVVLARGLGTRMREADAATALNAAEKAAADLGMKVLVPLEGERPFLDYGLSALADAGCREICLVIGPDHHAIRDRYLRVQPPQRFRIEFAQQAEPRGTANAVLAASEFAGGDEFLVVNGDNYYPPSALRSLVENPGPGAVLFDPADLARHSNIEPERIRAFALVEVDEQGFIRGITEKPGPETLVRLGDAGRVSMNCWRFDSSILEACRSVKPSSRGEFELTDAVVAALAAGRRLRALESHEGVLDLSRRADIPEVKARLGGVEVVL